MDFLEKCNEEEEARISHSPRRPSFPQPPPPTLRLKLIRRSLLLMSLSRHILIDNFHREY